MRRSWISFAVVAAMAGILLGSLPNAAWAGDNDAPSPHWRGWAVSAGGIALLFSGVAWQVQSSSDFERFDNRFEVLCPIGCVGEQLPQEISGLLDRARTRRTLAIASYSFGAVVTAAGALLLYRDAGPPDERLMPRTSRLLLMGGGVGTLALAGILQWRASVGFDRFDRSIEERCPFGCPVSSVPDLEDDLAAARLQRSMAFASYAVGAALIGTGAVLAYLDRRARMRALSVQPSLTPQGATLTLKGAF